MTKISLAVMSAALALGTAVSASAGVDDPEVLIYRFNGVRAILGSPATGTIFHCTNFSGATEIIRFVTRTESGAIAGNQTLNISHLQTVAASFAGITSYHSDLFLTIANGDLAIQGTTAIAATSANMFCTAMVMESNSNQFVPVGIALRGIRFAPVPGSQE